MYFECQGEKLWACFRAGAALSFSVLLLYFHCRGIVSSGGRSGRVMAPIWRTCRPLPFQSQHADATPGSGRPQHQQGAAGSGSLCALLGEP